MFESEHEAIVNCFNTRKGSLLFTRGFGLNGVDSDATHVNRDAVIQLATYYPTVNLNSIKGTINSNGYVVCNIEYSVKG